MFDTRVRPPVAPWALEITNPQNEQPRDRALARIGGVTAVLALLAYLTWRLAFTLPVGSWNRTVAFTLIAFEALLAEIEFWLARLSRVLAPAMRMPPDELQRIVLRRIFVLIGPPCRWMP